MSFDPLLEVHELDKAFGGVRAIDNLDFRVARAELRCLIGPNGAGKSTLLGLLAGVQRPDRGRIIWRGNDISRMPAYQRVRQGICLKFQTNRTYKSLSVAENLRIPRVWHRSHRGSVHEIPEIVDLLGLNHLVEVPTMELSHAEQQWLEIGMALATAPKLLLLDEPTAGMTVEETERTARLIRSLSAKGLAVLVVEHDMAFVRELGAPVTVLHDGCVFASGSLAELESSKEVQEIYLGEATHA